MTSTDNPTPTAEHPAVTPPGVKVAADLRTLADLADNHPQVATELARTVAQLYLVIGQTSHLSNDQVGDPLIEAGAHPVTPAMADPWWDTQAWQLPAGAVQLVVTRLAVPAAVELNPAVS